jgi:hypothetical protein
MDHTKFDNLMGPKVPKLSNGVMVNLLKVVDLDPRDQAELIKRGYGDVLRNTTA